MGYEIGIDVGGTFTDVVCRGDDGSVRIAKLPTTRDDPSQAVLAALEMARRDWDVPPGAITRFAHGTTAATNAVLERKGARIGLITTEGFRDVLEIGRQMRHQMYDLVLRPETPVFLAPGRYRKEVRERLDAQGPRADPTRRGQRASGGQPNWSQRACRPSRSACCSRFSIRRTSTASAPSSPKRIPTLPVSLSSDVDPAFREYERTCVTAFDAYIKPVIADYLANMERGLAAAGVTRAAAGDAVARRTDVVGDRAAASGAVVPVRARGGRDRRRRSRPRGGIPRFDHRRYRRHVLRHRVGHAMVRR